MKGEWCYWKSHFSDAFCDHVLDLGLKLKSQVGSMGAYNEYTDKNLRRSTTRFIHDYNKDFEFLFDAVWKCAIKSNERWFDFHINRLESIQLAEYDESDLGHYGQHIDTFWINPIRPGVQRKLSAIIQLSDPNDYEGGTFELLDAQNQKPNSSDIKERGTILFFPSFFNHRLNPVTKGKRYSLACWFEGPSFR